MISKYLKYLFLLFQIFIFGKQIGYAKIDLVLPLNSVCFSTELNQNFKRLEKEVQPNIGFLQEKYTFVISESVSAQNQYKFFEYFAGKLAKAGDDALSKLLKNTDYKKFYDDLASGATPRRFANELTIQEEAVLKFYTNKSYYNFNQALINGSKADEILEVEKLLNNTLDKIPSSAGTYYRGIGKIEIDKLITYKIGDEVPYDNFLSTSSELDEAAKFARKNHSKTGEGAMIIIESKNGKSIKRYSDAEFEYEVLHKSGSKFTLTKVEDNILLNVFEHQFDDYPAVYGKRYTLVEK